MIVLQKKTALSFLFFFLGSAIDGGLIRAAAVVVG